MLALPPLSLYIHFPWCVRKCPYCDFNSHESKGELPQAEYVECLLSDLRQDLAYVQGRELTSIFMGGGTPSLIDPGFIHTLLESIAGLIPLVSNAEITMEANPGTVEAGRFAGFLGAGVNRLSLGIQSFDDQQLRSLGRIHDATEARRAIVQATEAGFANFNLDLMYGLPGQEVEQALSDLEQALDFAPTHLSWYQLTVEPNTHYFSNPPLLPDEDSIMSMQDRGLALLNAAGLARYEISAYARAGRQSRHNLNYWLFGDYLGIGAGAHGKITLEQDGAVLRTRKYRQPDHYLRQDLNFTAETSRIAPTDLGMEFMLNALRLTGGFYQDDFELRTGTPFSSVAKQLESLREQGFLDIVSTGARLKVKPTDKGLLFTNTVLEAFA